MFSINSVKRYAGRYVVIYALPFSFLFINTAVSANSLNLATSNVNFSCNISLNTQITIAPQQVSFYQGGHASTGQAYSITKERLLVNGQNVVLSNSQKQAINSYDLLIRDTLVDVNLFLYDAFSTAQQSINQDFSALLGANSQPIQTANNELTKLKTQFLNYFNPANTIVIDNKGQFIDTIIGQNVDTYISSLSQTLLSDASVTLMSSMLASGESFSEIQTKVKTFAKQFKTTVKQHKNELNADAKKLCTKLNEIDKAEKYMQSHIPELATIDIFTL